MNLPIWNLALMNYGSLARDSLTCEYCHVDLPTRGMKESPLREGPPMDPSPKVQGLDEVFLGDSAGSRLGGALAELGPRAAFKGNGEPLALGELCMPPRLGGFKDSGTIFLTLEVGGLLTFGGSPPICTPCTEESGLISLGTLCKGI
jgi:hypothetical protein